MPRVPDEQMEIQIGAAEQALLTTHDPLMAQRLLVDEHGIHTKTARTWLKRVRQKWAAEAGNDDPEVRNTRRGEMRAILRSFMRRCALDNDMTNAVKFCKLLIDFDALAEPVKIQLDGRVIHDVNLKGRESLEGFLLAKVA